MLKIILSKQSVNMTNPTIPQGDDRNDLKNIHSIVTISNNTITY